MTDEELGQIEARARGEIYGGVALSEIEALVSEVRRLRSLLSEEDAELCVRLVRYLLPPEGSNPRLRMDNIGELQELGKRIRQAIGEPPDSLTPEKA